METAGMVLKRVAEGKANPGDDLIGPIGLK